MTDTPKPAKSHGAKSIRASAKPRDLMSEPMRKPGAWTAQVVTLFPQAFPGVLGQSLTGKALDEGLWSLDAVDLRRFGEGKHRNVDDTPTGGGAGMVIRADVMGEALDATAPARGPREAWPILYLSPRGEPFRQSKAQRLARCEGVTLICGRFEGLDERVIDHYAIEEVSLGDFVMTGGEIAAQALIDATVRLLPGVLGNDASAVEESFSNGLLEHPQFTRPTTWRGAMVPEILLSGHHGKIEEWRFEEAKRLTKERRPDLWAAYCAINGIDPDE